MSNLDLNIHKNVTIKCYDLKIIIKICIVGEVLYVLLQNCVLTYPDVYKRPI